MRLKISIPAICTLSLGVTTLANAQFKPAMVDGGSDAVLKLVNVQKLMERGQKDAVVMFDRPVFTANLGNVLATQITYASPGSERLQTDLVRAINAVPFTPALVDGKRTQVAFYGTATFSTKDGKPQLRIYANQEPDEIAAGHDFVAPQTIMVKSKSNDAVANLLSEARAKHKSGAVILSVSVDPAGRPTDVKVVSESPTGFHFGAAAAMLTREENFIPGFRNGKPAACTVKIRNVF
jgi:TonB family protein